jgi:hypothetical protein
MVGALHSTPAREDCGGGTRGKGAGGVSASISLNAALEGQTQDDFVASVSLLCIRPRGSELPVADRYDSRSLHDSVEGRPCLDHP